VTHPVRDQTWPDYPGRIEPGRAGRVTYKLRLVDGQLRLAGKQVLLVNRDQPLPTLAFLI
jgi:hypothetical protein